MSELRFPGRRRRPDLHTMSGWSINAVAPGPELVTDPGFDTGTDWTAGAGWSIAAGVAAATAATGNLDCSAAVPTAAKVYRVAFTVQHHVDGDRKSTRLNSSHQCATRIP